MTSIYTPSNLYTEICSGAQTTTEGICKLGRLYISLLTGSTLEEASSDPEMYAELFDYALQLEAKNENKFRIPKGIKRKKLYEKSPISTCYRKGAKAVNSIVFFIQQMSEDFSELKNLKEDKRTIDYSMLASVANTNNINGDFPLYDYFPKRLEGALKKYG